MGDRKRKYVEDGNNSEDNHIKFIFTAEVIGNKKKLAAVSDVFKTEFQYEKGEIKITDCTDKVFSSFIDILEGTKTFEDLQKSENFGLADLFDLLNCVEKYQIKTVGLRDSIVKAISSFSIDENNFLDVMQVVKQYKFVPLFQEQCEKLTKDCARIFLLKYRNEKDTGMEFFADVNKFDMEKKILIHELAEFERDFCRNCKQWKPSQGRRQSLDVANLELGIWVEIKMKQKYDEKGYETFSNKDTRVSGEVTSIDNLIIRRGHQECDITLKAKTGQHMTVHYNKDGTECKIFHGCSDYENSKR